MKLKILGVFVCLFVLILGTVGCGSTVKTKFAATKHISTEEVNLALARQTIAVGVIKCIHAEQHNGDTGMALLEISKKESLEIGQAVRELIAGFRKNSSGAMRTELAELAENLQSYCWPGDARRIRTVLTYG